MRGWLVRYDALVTLLGGVFVALYLWSWGEQAVTLENVAIWATVGVVMFNAVYRIGWWAYDLANGSDHRRQAEEQKAKDRRELIEAIQCAQRDTNEKILADSAEIKERLTKLLTDNAEMKEEIRQLGMAKAMSHVEGK